MRLSFLATASPFLYGAFAHTIFSQWTAGGKTYPVSRGIRTPSYDCTIDVTAGSTVQAVWRHTLQSGPEDMMDAGHKVRNCPSNYDPTITDKKIQRAPSRHIQEGGYKNGKWATNEVIENKGNQVIQIPKCIANGQYLLRAEMVALHGARSTNGAQLYMESAQLNITGGTVTASPRTHSIPGIHKSNDPGLLIDIYSLKTSNPYVIPGPPLFTCP
ncbi:family 61 glycosyl hydrolase [Pseudoneurospora amorphoporcata]|uniref:lytic cellulose monooxygenase (C4-dehydrogenating) n=1 Tax=Pseudoneurospora amorphoporcata TaxID=241081 RepID=A0AAN6SDW4_9PEZI|nr:family 61 glycosyl hydrolase [Pseudoneurospora amorphoporcata]